MRCLDDLSQCEGGAFSNFSLHLSLLAPKEGHAQMCPFPGLPKDTPEKTRPLQGLKDTGSDSASSEQTQRTHPPFLIRRLIASRCPHSTAPCCGLGREEGWGYPANTMVLVPRIACQLGIVMVNTAHPKAWGPGPGHLV